MPNSERVMEAMSAVFVGAELAVDEAAIDRMIELAAPEVAPGFTVLMGGLGGTAEYEGLDGMRRAWRDWLGGFAAIRLELERVADVGENVLIEVRQVGTTRHGVDVAQPSAALWRFRGQWLAAVEFHLDREEAARRAGEPLR